MFNTIFSKGAIPVAEQVLYFTRARHNAIATNIANADTPTYKAIDAPEDDFRAAMESAIKERDSLQVPVFEFEGGHHVHPKSGAGLIVDYIAQKRPGGLFGGEPGVQKGAVDGSGYLRHDENNVDFDMETVRMIRNTQLHNTMAQVLTHQFNLIHTAIRERV